MRDLDDARGISHGLSALGVRWHNKLSAALRLIAKGLRLKEPNAEAEKIEKRLFRRIAQEQAARVRDRRYDDCIDPWRGVAERPNAHWACYLVRLETNQQSKGRLRGAQSMNRKQAIENAASAKAEELRPVERRAVEMLERGAGKKRRVKPRKNIVEKRAKRLAESVKRQWFPNLHMSKVGAKHDVDRPILLSITDVVSIAAPIIEEFAKGPIAFHKRGSDSDPPSFEALYSIVCAYAKDGAACNKSTVNRLLSRVRKRGDARGTQDQDLRIDIAPELGSYFNER